MRREGAAVLAVLALLAGCAPRPLLARAIRARGGPLDGVVREVEARVLRGVPGIWTWRTVFAVPDRYAWTIYTAAEPNHLLFDGTTARTFAGGQLVASEAGTTAVLRTHARFTAAMNLDALLLPGVQTAPLTAAELPAGAVSGLVAVYADDGSRYRLGFDARDLVVVCEGPIALPPVAAGRLEARPSDYRRERRWLLPHATAYALDGAPLAAETARAVCPAPGVLGPDAFRDPAGLPTCDGAADGLTSGSKPD